MMRGQLVVRHIFLTVGIWRTRWGTQNESCFSFLNKDLLRERKLRSIEAECFYYGFESDQAQGIKVRNIFEQTQTYQITPVFAQAFEKFTQAADQYELYEEMSEHNLVIFISTLLWQKLVWFRCKESCFLLTCKSWEPSTVKKYFWR